MTDEKRFYFRAVPIVRHAEGIDSLEWSECSNQLLELIQEADAEVERLRNCLLQVVEAMEGHNAFPATRAALWQILGGKLP